MRRNNGGTVTLDPKNNIERTALLLVARLTGDKKLYDHIKDFREGAKPGVIDLTWFEESDDEQFRREVITAIRDALEYDVKAVVFEYGDDYAENRQEG